MPKRPLLLKPSGYRVYSEGPLIKLQVDNSVLPMTWDVAIRMGARLRVATRSAYDYRGGGRTLPESSDEGSLVRRQAIRENNMIGEGDYRVFAEEADVILQVGSNSRLTMVPEVSRNISLWLTHTGTAVRDKYAPDLELRFAVADLTDGVAQEKLNQIRRDSTATFG